MTIKHEITPDELEAALNAYFYPDPPCSFYEHYEEHVYSMTCAITAFLEARAKKGQGDA